MNTETLTSNKCTDCGAAHHSYRFGSSKCLRCTERWADVETAHAEALWEDWNRDIQSGARHY